MEEKKQTNGKKNERDFESESSFFVFPFLVLFFSESSFFVFPFFVLFFHDVLALQSSSDGPTEQALRAAAAARAVPALEQSRPRDSRRASDGTTPTVRGPRRRGPCGRAAPPALPGAPPDDRHRSERPAVRDRVEARCQTPRQAQNEELRHDDIQGCFATPIKDRTRVARRGQRRPLHEGDVFRKTPRGCAAAVNPVGRALGQRPTCRLGQRQVQQKRSIGRDEHTRTVVEGPFHDKDSAVSGQQHVLGIELQCLMDGQRGPLRINAPRPRTTQPPAHDRRLRVRHGEPLRGGRGLGRCWWKILMPRLE